MLEYDGETNAWYCVLDHEHTAPEVVYDEAMPR